MLELSSFKLEISAHYIEIPDASNCVQDRPHSLNSEQSFSFSNALHLCKPISYIYMPVCMTASFNMIYKIVFAPTKLESAKIVFERSTLRVC